MNYKEVGYVSSSIICESFNQSPISFDQRKPVNSQAFFLDIKIFYNYIRLVSMDKQLAQVLSNSLGKELVKWILVREEISNYLKQNPIDDKSFVLDLNPQIFVQKASKLISKVIIDSGFPCTPEEVMLFWLTESLLDRSKYNLQHKDIIQEKPLNEFQKEEANV